MSLDSWSSSEGSREARSCRPRVIGCCSGVSLVRRAGGWVSGCTDAKPVGEEVRSSSIFFMWSMRPIPTFGTSSSRDARSLRPRAIGWSSVMDERLVNSVEAIDSGSEIIANLSQFPLPIQEKVRTKIHLTAGRA